MYVRSHPQENEAFVGLSEEVICRFKPQWSSYSPLCMVFWYYRNWNRWFQINKMH